MRRSLVWTIGLTAALVVGCVHSPVLWSPDGRWLAYTAVVRKADRLEPGWIFGQAASAPQPSAVANGRGSSEVSAYRIWATRAETGESVLLEDSPGPLTSPGWNPDGTALAFGRLVREPEGGARFEIVVQEALDRRRVLRVEALAKPGVEGSKLLALGVAWSPDGRYLAVPQLQPRGLAVLRADDGRLVKSIDDAYLPSWAPEGGKLAFYRTGEPEGLYSLDARFGEPKFLTEVPHAVLAPAWTRDGRSLWVVRHRPAGVVDLLKVGSDGQGMEVVKTLLDEVPAEETYLGTSFSIGPDGQDLLATTQVEGQTSEIVWHNLRNNSILKRFNPIDQAVPLGGLALSPNGKWLALRAGAAGIVAPPALCETETSKLVPLVPDDATRAEWVVLLVDTARTLLRDQFASTAARGRVPGRPTLLPIPGEAGLPPDFPSRLRRLANLGRPLCDRPGGSPPAGPALNTLLAEARLFFDALREDYDAALADLDAFEPTAEGPDQRLRLLGLRAQLYLGKGDVERSREAIAYLKATSLGTKGRLEMTPDGPALTDEAPSRDGWPEALAECAEALAKSPTPAPAAAENARALLDDRREVLLPAGPAPAPPPRPVRRFPPRMRRPALKIAPPPPPPPAPPAAPDAAADGDG